MNDLAGVRVLAFPRSRWIETDHELRQRFGDWAADPVPGFNKNDEPLAFKYYGYCRVSDKVRGELQIVPMLTGLFWKVEHSAIYKPLPRLRGEHPEMKERTREVHQALTAFEEEFERLVRRYQQWQ